MKNFYEVTFDNNEPVMVIAGSKHLAEIIAKRMKCDIVNFENDAVVLTEDKLKVVNVNECKDQDAFYKALKDSDIYYIRLFADDQFHRQDELSSEELITVSSMGMSVSDPWMDQSARFELTTEEAIKEWGGIPFKEFVLKVKEYLCDEVLNDIIDEFMDTHISKNFRQYLETEGYFHAPASRKFHGSFDGGLVRHCYAVTRKLLELTDNNNLTWQRPESPYIIGLFHDLCKIDQYKKTSDGYKYNEDRLLKGHGDKSVMLLSQFMTLTEEEIACIMYHMGAFVPEKEWLSYTNAIHKYPNVAWTHMADLLAAHVDLT